jgi:hypothetical protein
MMKGIYKDLSNADYHGNKSHLSSSALKLLLDDPIEFHKKYILGTSPALEGEHFDIGTAIHAKVLEPEKYDDQVTVYTGKVKRGREWEEFKAQNPNKIILGNMGAMRVERASNALLRHKGIRELLEMNGESELAFFTTLNNLPVKSKKDRISFEGKFILDVKSMAGIINEQTIHSQVEKWSYDLSAALYIDIANEVLFETDEYLIEKFYWAFTSTDMDDAKLVECMPEMLEQGRRKYQEAIRLYQMYTENGWKIEKKDKAKETVRSEENMIIRLYPREVA